MMHEEKVQYMLGLCWDCTRSLQGLYRINYIKIGLPQNTKDVNSLQFIISLLRLPAVLPFYCLLKQTEADTHTEKSYRSTARETVIARKLTVLLWRKI